MQVSQQGLQPHLGQPRVCWRLRPCTKGIREAAWQKECSPRGARLTGRAAQAQLREMSYQGLIGERVRVVDLLGSAVHVSWLARTPQGWNDLVMVPTAEQLGLSWVQGDPWGHRQGKVAVRSHSLCSHP